MNVLQSWIFLILAMLSPVTTVAQTSWYTRPDGGTRYSSGFTYGMCDGKTDAAYPGTTNAWWLPNHVYALGTVIADNSGHYETVATAGTSGSTTPVWASAGVTEGTVRWTQGALYPVNQHCAFNDIRFLIQDGTYYGYNTYRWIIAGGDTVVWRGSIADGVSYRVGWSFAGSYCPDTNYFPCFGYAGDATDSVLPAPPSGTSAAHTKILGGNYASCTTQSSRTQVHGGYSAYDIFDLRGVSYLDMACLDLTDFAQCGRAGETTICNTTTPPYDDSASHGFRLDNNIHNVTFTDIRVHGLSVDAFYGPVGDAVTLNRVDMIGNAGAGWNADNGTTGSGNLLIENFNISWNGCVEEYPLVDALPYTQCTDDASASHGGSAPGYGDGFGTTTVAGTVPWHIKFQNGIVSYNTQDGLDALHANGAGSTTDADRILAYSNMGNQIKIGADGNRSITNSIIHGNCNAMQGAIPGTPTGYNTLLTDFCRAGDEATITSMNDGSVTTFTGNTIYGFRAGTTVNNYGDLMGLICASTCTAGTPQMIYADNILVGFDPNAVGRYPAQYYMQSGYTAPFSNTGSIYRNNLVFHTDTACPDAGETNSLCVAPQLNDVTWHAYGYADTRPTAGSNVLGAGYNVGLSTDYSGAARSTPPSIGAYDGLMRKIVLLRLKIFGLHAN